MVEIFDLVLAMFVLVGGLALGIATVALLKDLVKKKDDNDDSQPK